MSILGAGLSRRKKPDNGDAKGGRRNSGRVFRRFDRAETLGAPFTPREGALRGKGFLKTKEGGLVVLRKALNAGGLYRERRRPPYWRSLSPSLAGGAFVPEQRLNNWLLVLTAKKIPYIFFNPGNRPRIFVPALYEGVALHEIRAFEREAPAPVYVAPAQRNTAGVLLFLSLLFAWHGLRWGVFDLSLPAPPFPEDPKDWSLSFGLDAYRVRVLHEWWRALTALTLHADDSHMLGNMGFGLLFLIPLCRRVGLGLGIGLALCAGVFGNVGNALSREAHVLSIGFSTALFGAVGCLCVMAGVDSLSGHKNASRYSGSGLAPDLARRLAMPLGAGMALLGILGGGAEARTDYAAHIWGFCAGLGVCLMALPAERALTRLPAREQSTVQALLFAGDLALLTGVWLYALWR